eukprot:CAMPEP_0170506946 /NCGR_PEP_ID=MMETSP0208-20121228/56998_1 /TAXON_ID=197538 /ORGANISM="Strombidium inclinatum, Strain S3" /LENGTH=91 /DNA_ID=CAMNT_0010788829 /DNA_START=2897 /DNA_END=3172 /DNA_ORIENTATION=-
MASLGEGHANQLHTLSSKMGRLNPPKGKSQVPGSRPEEGKISLVGRASGGLNLKKKGSVSLGDIVKSQVQARDFKGTVDLSNTSLNDTNVN